MRDIKDTASIIAIFGLFIALSLVISDIRLENAPMQSNFRLTELNEEPNLVEIAGNYIKSEEVLRRKGSGRRVLMDRWPRTLVKCEDADKGADMLTKSYTVTGGGKFVHDTCKDPFVLLEATCSKRYGSGKHDEIDCSYYGMKCKAGRCVK